MKIEKINFNLKELTLTWRNASAFAQRLIETLTLRGRKVCLVHVPSSPT